MQNPNHPQAVLSISGRMRARLQKSWLVRDWLAFALLGMSYVYQCLFALRRVLYTLGIFKSTRLPVPVIIVGNVVAGGAGKTPVVIDIVQHLQRQGWRVGVVSRGYGRSAAAAADAAAALEVTAHTPVVQSGDEPALIYQSTQAPVFVATSRVAAGQALLAAHPKTQVLVCDDGLQHLALQRDIEIGVFDERGVGNGWLLPAGPLRESWPRALDFVLQTSADKPPVRATRKTRAFVLRRQLAPYALRADGSQVPLSDLAGLALHALAGIAQPEAFFAMLRANGLTLAHTTALPDHYKFNSELLNIHVGKLHIFTLKDAVKIWPQQSSGLAVPLIVDIPEAFYTALTAQLAGSLPAQAP